MKRKKQSFGSVNRVKPGFILVLVLILELSLITQGFGISGFFNVDIVSPGHAISEQAGTSGGRFLKLKFGARAIGMGGAYIAETGDLFAAQWNPASPVLMESRQFVGQHNDMLLDMEARHLGLGPVSWKDLEVNGFVSYFDKGSFQGTRETSGGAFAGYTGTFGAHDLKSGIGASGLVNPRLSAGAAVKLLRSKIAGYEATGVAVDLGMNYKVKQGVHLGGVIQNLGTEMEFIEQSDPLPLVYGVGLTYRRNYNKNLDYQGNVDLVNPRDADPALRFGVECMFLDTFALRGGYRSGEDLGDGLSIGLGFQVENLKLDYAHRSSGDLFDRRQNFSIAYSFH